MPTTSEAFFEGGMAVYAAAAAAFAAAALLLLPAIRNAFRRRIRAPGCRNGSRLGVVETLALGRRRQLVSIRRDDIEHLVMTGGPNDAAIGVDTIAAVGRDRNAIDETWPGEEPPVVETRFGPVCSLCKRTAGVFAAQDLLPLAVLAGIAGAGTGLICGVFRLSLDAADRFRLSLPASWQGQPVLGCSLLIAGAAAAAAFSAWLVRRFSAHAVGSGIPHVEAALRGEMPPAPFILLPVKFAGGVLAIGAGLALGREGPCVQMGATAAHLLGKAFGRNQADCRSLLAAGAGAGLAAAFNAPLAGAAFVLEELTRKFEPRHAIAALGASGSAIVVARLFTGRAPDFSAMDIPYPALADDLFCFAFGLVAGVLGVAYNRLLLGALAMADRLARWPAEIRAALVGAAAGALAWFAPELAGGGDNLTQRALDGTEPLALLPLVFMFRLVFGAGSYAAGTPGGLFAPLLVLGAQMGYLFGAFAAPGQGEAAHAAAFAMTGMAAFFAAVVRAPLTGMILVTEMTGTSRWLLPMLAACFSAMAVAALLREPPIYDSLKERTLAAWGKRPD